MGGAVLATFNSEASGDSVLWLDESLVNIRLRCVVVAPHCSAAPF